MTEIKTWLESGCQVKEGLILLEKYSDNKFLIRLVKSSPNQCKDKLKAELCRIAGVTDKQIREKRKQDVKPFREEFPFLDNPDCPFELKALITDKFSSFYAYKSLHEQLFDCTNAKECAKIAGDLMANFKENRMIFAELDYYRKHKTVLGKHPVFGHFSNLKELRKLSIKDLVKKQIKLQHNIWRIESEIKKGDRPHLDSERRRRMNDKEKELAEVNRLLE